MARAMWRGAIQFGLVTIPVRMYLATESRGGLSFNLLHADDLERIQMRIHCPEHGEIPRSETVRGYEWSKGHYVVIEESDLEAVPLRTVRAIEIEQFVPARRESATAAFVRQAYYLEPEPVGRKAFGLLRQVLADTSLQAICKIVLKDREQLAALDPFGPTLMLSTLYWPDEVRDMSELDLPTDDVAFKPAEMAMARQLVEALSGDFDAARYRDEYREALMRVIDAKVAGEPVDVPAARAESSPLADLMAVLEASVEAARRSRSEVEKAAAPIAAQGPPARAAEPVSVDEARRGRSSAGRRASKTSTASSAPAAGAGTPDAGAQAPHDGGEVAAGELAGGVAAAIPPSPRRRKSA